MLSENPFSSRYENASTSTDETVISCLNMNNKDHDIKIISQKMIKEEVNEGMFICLFLSV